MNDHIRGIYLLEATTQCQFATNAVRTLNNILPKWEEASRNGDLDTRIILHDEIFRTLHSLMTHASNVSKLFWPARPRPQKNETDSDFNSRCSKLPKLIRAAELRDLLKLPDDGHPLKSRKLRDHLEHFDERLDHWQTKSVRKNYFQDSIGIRESLSGFDDADIMRWYNPLTKRMLFRGESFDIQELVNGINDVRTRLDDLNVNH